MIDISTSPIQEQLAVAWKHFEAGERERAEQLCRQLLANFSDDGDLQFLLGRITIQERRPAESEAHFEAALRARPDWSEAWNNLGNARAIQGALDAAEQAYREALRLAPRYPEALNNLGNVLRERGLASQAEEYYRLALRGRPRYAEAHNNLGLALRQLQRAKEAMECFNEALHIQQDYPEAWNNLGIMHATRGEHAAAIAAFERALQLRPDYLSALKNIGLAQFSCQRLEQAQATLERIISLTPDSVESHLQLGRVLEARSAWSEAARRYERALRIAPGCAEACALAGHAHLACGDPERAIQRLSHAIAQHEHDVAARLWRGIAYEALNRFAEAEHDFAVCLERDPNCQEARLRLGKILVRRGDSPAGWSLLAATALPASQSLARDWQVRCDRGWSDAIVMARYGAAIEAAGGSLTLLAPRELCDWLVQCEHVRNATPIDENLNSTVAMTDVLALPHCAGAAPEDMGATIPYWKAPAKQSNARRDQIGGDGTLRVGIVFKQNWGMHDDAHGEIPVEFLQGLTRISGITAYCISTGDAGRQRELLVHEFGMVDCRRWFGDEEPALADLAELLECFDLVIAADGVLAHASAAAGRETWVLMNAHGDWRWRDDREVGAWYPHVRLFRTPTPHRWHETIAAVEAALRERLGAAVVADQDADAAESHLRLGQRCYAERRLGEAESSFLHALRWRPDFPEALVELGNVYRHQQREVEAESCYRRAIELCVDYAEALNNLGISLASRREFAAAIEVFQHAVRIRPAFTAALGNLGKALLDLGRIDEAIEQLQLAIDSDARFPHAYVNLADALRRGGRNQEAASAYRGAIAADPDQPSAHSALGVVLRDVGDIPASVSSFQQALRLDPDNPELQNNLGISLARLEEYDAAIDCYRRALALRPDFPDAYNNQGIALAKIARREEALQSYLQALRLRDRYPEAHNNLGIVLTELGRHAEAIEHFEEALRLKPGYAAAHSNLGIALTEQGHLPLAEAQYSEALHLDADYADGHMNRALVRLVQGDMTAGWEEYEWRWRCNNARMPAIQRPLWNGESLEGKRIVLHAEQGLGDTLQFVRYAPLVKARGAHVTVMCQGPLLELLKRTPGIDRLTPKIMDGNLPDCDYHVPLIGLPRIFETTLSTVPADTPYLFADPELVDRWRGELNDGATIRIGINWQGNPRYRGDRQRSIPLIYFSTLAKIPNVRLFGLQKNHGREQLADVAGSFSVVDLGPRLDEGTGAFMDTAAVVTSLDLIVTSDTAFAHLCGGLGAPTWLALPFAADWRWLQHTEESPWYPTMQLFRQPRFGDWGSVFDRMADALRRFANEKSRDRPLFAPVSPGELIDKITILRIKLQRIHDQAKRGHVEHELQELTSVLQRAVSPSPELDELTDRLSHDNLRLWDIEDAIRDCERNGDFGDGFIKLARSVYYENDCRAATKREINNLLGSRIVEEKSYADYESPSGSAGPGNGVKPR
ncbi:MAG: tetratricopeptide repeat protein [Planctomycetia bacterium]|nr:tetratricopeptide repeat protein [Planctomycetia bacterium]